MGRPDTARAAAPRRAMGALAALACVVVTITAAAPSAPAATDPGDQKRSVDRKIDDLKDHLDDTSAALSKAYTSLKTTQNKLPAARSALEKARAAADAADRAEAEATQQLEVAKANETKAQGDLEDATAEVAAGRKRMAQFAAQIYQQQGFGQLDVALSSTEPQDFADRLAMVDTVLDVQNRTMERLSTEQAGLTALEDHLSALRADSDRKQKAAAAALARAQQARQAAVQAQADLEALAATQTKVAQSYEDQLAADKKQLASMQAEAARLRKILAARAAAARAKAAAEAKKNHNKPSTGGGGGGSSNGSGVLSRPVRTGWVSSEYGMRFHPIYHYWKLHSGRDYAVNCGTPVYAAAGGTVISAGWGGGYGNRIVIDHGLERGVGLASTYNHLSRIVVGGGSVSRGQLIGYSGTTGTSTGCHLHFETLENGSFANPRKWLNTLS